MSGVTGFGASGLGACWRAPDWAHAERAGPRTLCSKVESAKALNPAPHPLVVDPPQAELDFDNDDDVRVMLLVHDTKPPFLDGRVVFTKQVGPSSRSINIQIDTLVHVY